MSGVTAPLFISCGVHGHGRVLWSGESICDCGRVHHLGEAPYPLQCACGVTHSNEALDALNPICPRCYRAKREQQEAAPS